MFEKDLVIEIWLNGSKDQFEVLSAGQIEVRLLLSNRELNVSSSAGVFYLAAGWKS
ncbi:MAG: hypothetical protein ACE362_21230 [Phaeodactylibacter xiamenensis]|uniref:hypothetical protein n=1 Tax=Phaeodactylibacter xiamenensis TaxID=1524460 RepID=UPI00136479B8|nr:hypothetical protein [Phaeodactylibacter xiamenensis]MCR9050859.1 hypothetical protein [bacterium]